MRLDCICCASGFTLEGALFSLQRYNIFLIYANFRTQKTKKYEKNASTRRFRICYFSFQFCHASATDAEGVTQGVWGLPFLTIDCWRTLVII